MAYEENTDTMKAFFKGRVRNDIPEYKLVELGHGRGIGHVHGSYSQYTKKLSEQRTKGNGVISIGKSIKEDTFSIPDPTDKFTVRDVPHLLIMYNNIIDDISLKVIWKDSDNDTILEQYYNVPSPYSMGNYWWESYGIYFIGPEDLDEGNYRVEITSEETITKEHIMGDKKDNIKTLTAYIDFSVEDS